MDLNRAEQLAISLMKQHGIYELGWRFEFDRAKRRFGVCRYRNKTIGLSKYLTAINDEARIKNTILHEIAHALVGYKHGHDEVWRRKAIEIGCDGERCVNQLEANVIKGKYQAVCKNGHVHYRHKATKEGRKSSCGICSKRFNPEFILEYKIVH